jgi:hypothetical protein
MAGPLAAGTIAAKTLAAGREVAEVGKAVSTREVAGGLSAPVESVANAAGVRIADVVRAADATMEVGEFAEREGSAEGGSQGGIGFAAPRFLGGALGMLMDGIWPAAEALPTDVSPPVLTPDLDVPVPVDFVVAPENLTPLDDLSPVEPPGTGWSLETCDPEPYSHTWDPTCFDGYGMPLEDAEVWRLQNGPSCAVNAQLMVIEVLTGECLPETETCDWLEGQGWYDPRGGTSMQDLDRLLIHNGIETEVTGGADISDIADALERGDKVIVPLNAQEIWEPLRDPDTGEVVPQPGPYGHAVVVTGIDQNADGSFTVILNDSGTPNGQMSAVALEDFLEAWEDYDNQMIVAKADSVTPLA